MHVTVWTCSKIAAVLHTPVCATHTGQFNLNFNLNFTTLSVPFALPCLLCYIHTCRMSSVVLWRSGMPREPGRQAVYSALVRFLYPLMQNELHSKLLEATEHVLRVRDKDVFPSPSPSPCRSPSPSPLYLSLLFPFPRLTLTPFLSLSFSLFPFASYFVLSAPILFL